jgi:hypothetical protein
MTAPDPMPSWAFVLSMAVILTLLIMGAAH